MGDRREAVLERIDEEHFDKIADINVDDVETGAAMGIGGSVTEAAQSISGVTKPVWANLFSLGQQRDLQRGEVKLNVVEVSPANTGVIANL